MQGAGARAGDLIALFWKGGGPLPPPDRRTEGERNDEERRKIEKAGKGKSEKTGGESPDQTDGRRVLGAAQTA